MSFQRSTKVENLGHFSSKCLNVSSNLSDTNVIRNKDEINSELKNDSFCEKDKSFKAEIEEGIDPNAPYIIVDGDTMNPEELILLGKGDYKIKLSKSAWERVKKGRQVIDDVIENNKVVYGITTGFGRFAGVRISSENLEQLQINLIRSHAAGIGQPLSPEKTRRLLALRINVLAKGHSGISPENLKKLVDAFNASCLSFVPEKGTVGASGDLAPLSHLALGLLGEGKMWNNKTEQWENAVKVLECHGLQPMHLLPKEGLALINGTQFITSIGVEALVRAENIARQADVVMAVTFEAVKGIGSAYDEDIHKLRRHEGQNLVASRLRTLLHSDVYPSEINDSSRGYCKVQDAYTIRCVPQVHGIAHDTLTFVRKILTDEMNAATDNPLVLADRDATISGGNFHGEYPSKVLDFLAIAIHEVGSLSERRIERLINSDLHGLTDTLPNFLVRNGGINSGFMILHCTAAALVSENKVLCHPASVDSLPTSGGTEDHVSMGGFSARKALTVVENVEYVVAIELMAACQAVEFHRPLKTTKPLEAVLKLLRSEVSYLKEDRFMSPDIEVTARLLREGKIWEEVNPYIENYEKRKTTTRKQHSDHDLKI